MGHWLSDWEVSEKAPHNCDLSGALDSPMYFPVGHWLSDWEVSEKAPHNCDLCGALDSPMYCISPWDTGCPIGKCQKKHRTSVTCVVL